MLKGTKHSKESKDKISKYVRENPVSYWLGKKRPPFSETCRYKMSLSRRGRKLSEECRKKISETRKLKVLRGEPLGGMKNKKHTEETKRKISIALRKENWMKNSHYARKNAPYPITEKCEICGVFGKDFKKGLYCDHDHKTGNFRGWICQRCNTIIGMCKENIESLFLIIKYIKKFSEK